MAWYEFGIMERAPGLERYDEYEPGRFGCIPVRDDLLDDLLPQLVPLECYWHTLARPAQALCECGINLIPPQSLPRFLRLLRQAARPELNPLTELLETAAARQKFVILYGL